MHLVSFERRDLGQSEGLFERGLDFETLEFSRPGVCRVGAILPPGPRAGDLVDLNRALALKLTLDDAGAPEAEADSLLPAEMIGLLRRGSEGLDRAADVTAWVRECLERYDGPDLERAGAVVARRRSRLRAPVARPGKILGVGRNYRAHAAERGQRQPPTEPILFLKAVTAVSGPGDEVWMPRASREVDYEGELAVVLGRFLHDADPAEAARAVAGYCAANDFSARDFQNVRGQAFIGKSCDGFAALGPALVTRASVPDAGKLRLRTVVSGECRQDASTEEMIFGIPEILSFASRLMTLEPGDVVLTGTPAGVGAASDPPRWLRDGDVVDVEIEGIGLLRSHLRGEGGEETSPGRG